MKKQIHCVMLITFVTMLAISSISAAQQNAEESAIILECRLKEGDQITWKMNIDSKMSGTNLPGETSTKVGLTWTRIVSQVSEDGLLNLIDIKHAEIIQIKMNGMDMLSNIPIAERDNWGISRLKMRKDGGLTEVEKTSDYSVLSPNFFESLASAASLPDKPVKVGSSWTQTAEGDVSVLSITYTLLGFEVKDGYECAKIKGEMAGTLNLQGFNANIEKSETLTYFAVKDGMEVEQNSTMKMQMDLPGGQKVTTDVSTEMRIQDKKHLIPEELQETVNSVALLESGSAQLLRKEYDNAKATFEEFLSKYKESSFRSDVEKLMAKTNEPSQDRQRRLREQGNLEEMLKLAQEAIKSGTATQIMLEELLSAYIQYDRTYELISVFEKAVEDNPDDPIICKILGNVYASQNDYVKAIGVFEKAETLAPNDADIQSNLGQAYLAQGMPEKAIEAYRKAIDLQPGLPYFYPQLARAYVSAGKTDEALKLADELKQSIEKQEISMDQAFALINLGDTYLTVKHYDEAIESYKKAVELSPGNDGYFKDKLARAYEEAGKPDLAAEVRQSMPQEPFRPGLQKKIAPSFILRDLENKEINLLDFKGKVVILNFFATWAPQCKKQNMVLEELNREYTEKGLAVIGVSVDKGTVDVVKSYIEKQKVSYPIAISTQEMLEAYGEAIGKKIKELPTTLIIDKEGRIDFIQPGYLDRAVIEGHIVDLMGLTTPVVPAERPKELQPVIRPTIPME